MRDPCQTKLLETLSRFAEAVEACMPLRTDLTGIDSLLLTVELWKTMHELLYAGANLVPDPGTEHPFCLSAGSLRTPYQERDYRRTKAIAASSCVKAVRALPACFPRGARDSPTTHEPDSVPSADIRTEASSLSVDGNSGSARAVQSDGSSVQIDNKRGEPTQVTKPPPCPSPPTQPGCCTVEHPPPVAQVETPSSDTPAGQVHSQSEQTGLDAPEVIDFALGTKEMGAGLVDSIKRRLQTEAYRIKFEDKGFIKIKINNLPEIDMTALTSKEAALSVTVPLFVHHQ